MAAEGRHALECRNTRNADPARTAGRRPARLGANAKTRPVAVPTPPVAILAGRGATLVTSVSLLSSAGRGRGFSEIERMSNPGSPEPGRGSYL
jgi:hypothetical protein